MEVGIKSKVEKLRRKLKRRRGWLLASLIFAFVAVAFLYAIIKPEPPSSWQNSESSSVNAQLAYHAGGELVLHKIYVCGDQYESLGYYSEEEIEAVARRHADWKLEGIDGDDRIIYSTEVEDLSPNCRRNAYFGLDHNNSLTLFEGKPSEGKIVRTYFQLNIEHLENSLPQETVMELHEGIKISDFAEFNSVLSTFSDFSLDEAEQVVKPTSP